MADQKHIYGAWSMVLVPIIGGPFATTYMLAHNFSALGQSVNALRTYALGIILSIAQIVLSTQIPNDIFVIPLEPFTNVIPMILGASIFRNFQNPVLLQMPGEIPAQNGLFKGIVVAAISFIFTLIVLFWTFFILSKTGYVEKQKQKAEDNVALLATCFKTFSDTAEATDQDHLGNMRRLVTCAKKVYTHDSKILQGCTNAALDAYVLDPSGKMENRKEVDAGFIRCLSRQ